MSVATLHRNPERAAADWPAAVIAGAYQTGVLAVRGLKRRGVRAYCFDADAANPGFRSVYGPARLCPNPDRDPDGWVRFMEQLAQEIGGRPALIASSDRFVTAIARHAAALAPHYRLSPGTAMQGLLADKDTQYDLAARHGMPMPLTRFARTVADVEQFAAETMYPCLLKPTHFREWTRVAPDHPLYGQKIAMAATAAELIALYHQAAVINPLVILQEIIEGPDTGKRVYLSCYDAHGERIAHAMFRELRCQPMQFGPATVTDPIDDPETDAICDGFLRRIGYRGLCEIEMKVDTRDGRVKLIEANPRLSGGGDAAPYAGVELAWLHYLDLVGQPVVPVSPSPRYFKHIVLRSDAIAAVDYLRAGLITWGDVVRSYRPPIAFFDLDWRDWRYSLETVLIAGRSVCRGLLATLTGGRPA